MPGLVHVVPLEPEVPLDPELPLDPEEPLDPELPLEPEELPELEELEAPLDPDEPLEPDVPSEPEAPLDPAAPLEPDEVPGSVASEDDVCGAKRSCVLAPLQALASAAITTTLDPRTTAAARDFMAGESYGAEQRCPTSSTHRGDSFVSPLSRDARRS